MAAAELSREELLAENAELRERLEEAESAVRAIRGGEVDAFVISHPEGESVYTLERAELIQQLLLVTAELRQAKEAAEAANHAKDQFLANLSHELRTPLAPVLAMADGLERNELLPAEVRKGLKLIRRNVELEAHLIDDLLDLTRIAQGKLDLSVQTTDLSELIEQAIQACCSPHATEKGLQIRTEFAAGDHRVQADPARLLQVFWNLMSNAVKFTPPGGAVTVRTRQEDGLLIVEVADSGIGIEAELLEKIFDAFDQGRPGTTRRFGGLGLGLAISRTIVDLHRGVITAESEGPGRGARFTVALPSPVMPAEPMVPARPAAARESAAESAAERAAGRPLRIFLIEDHADTAEAMAHLLGALGHQVTVAGSVRAALDSAAAVHAVPGGGFDLVISDLGLPDGSGLELMKQLADRYGLKGIALSGYGMEEDVLRSGEAGFAKHITKPVTLAALESAVQEVAASSGILSR